MVTRRQAPSVRKAAWPKPHLKAVIARQLGEPREGHVVAAAHHQCALIDGRHQTSPTNEARAVWEGTGNGRCVECSRDDGACRGQCRVRGHTEGGNRQGTGSSPNPEFGRGGSVEPHQQSTE